MNEDRHRTTHRLDAESVKVLAHPLRSRLLTTLRRSGPATATTLAEVLHTNTGVTSYHLRRLEAGGLVADTGEGTGRRRLWRATANEHAWENTDFDGDEDARAALGWLVRDYHRQFDLQYATWLDREEAWPPEWRRVTGMTNATVQVTPAQMSELVAEVEALVRRYADAGESDPDSRRITVWSFAFPLEDEPAPEDGADR